MKNPTLLLSLMLLLAGVVTAQEIATPSDFKIGPADEIEIIVLGVDDFSRTLRLNSSGTIRMPFLGEIKLAGLTPAEAEEKLADLLQPDYVVDPQVSVIVTEPRSRMFSIMGAVMKPGQYQMLEQITLVTAIAGAGGLKLEKVGDTAIIQRNSAASDPKIQPVMVAVDTGDPSPTTSFQIDVDLTPLMQGDTLHDIPIQPGDVINIPEREEKQFFVIGDVNRPGAFEFPQEYGIRLSRALAMAGGPTRTSSIKSTALIRQHDDGSTERIAINLDKVLEGKHPEKDPDLELQPNDMLYIPGSVSKNLFWGLLGQVPYTMTRAVITY
jgi:polysaccharide export outer membrane protein